MSEYVKFSIVQSSSAKTNVANAIEYLEDANKSLGNFSDSAVTTAEGFDLNKDVDNIPTEYSQKLEQVKNSDEAVQIQNQIAAWQTGKKTYNQTQKKKYIANKDDICKPTSEISNQITIIEEIKTALENLEKAIETFEENNVSIEEAIKSIKNGEMPEGFATQTVEIDGEEVEQVVYTDQDGNTWTISEMVNCAYTYTGTAANAVVAWASVNANLSYDEKDAGMSALLGQIGSAINSYKAKGFFSVASSEDIKSMYQDAFKDDESKDYSNLNSDFKSLLEGYDIDKDKYGDYLNSEVGSDITKSMGIAGLAMGAYTLTDEFKDNSTTTDDALEVKSDDSWSDIANDQSSGNYPGNGGSNGGSYPGGSNGGSSSSSSNDKNKDKNKNKDKDKDKNKDKDKAEEDTEKETELDVKEPEEQIPEIEQKTENTLPESITAETGEKDYDALAREQFEAQGEEAIAAHRAEVVEEANSLFEAEDKGPLIEKLKEYGYNDAEINDIIQSRDLTTSALIQGDQKAQLAQIAKDLAAADKVENFDTSYDNGQGYEDFFNGNNEELLANMSQDPTVASAKALMTDAQTKYTDSVAVTNEALAKVTESNKNIDTVTNEIKTDIANNTSSWTKSQQNSFNAEVEAAKNNFVKQNGDATKWTATQIDEYNNLTNGIKQKYVEAIQNDQTKWSSEQVTRYNEAVKQYNESVKDAQAKYDNTQALKSEFDTKREAYNQATNSFMENTKNESASLNSGTDSALNGIQSPTESTSETPSDGVTVTDQSLLDSLNITGDSMSIGE